VGLRRAGVAVGTSVRRVGVLACLLRPGLRLLRGLGLALLVLLQLLRGEEDLRRLAVRAGDHPVGLALRREEDRVAATAASAAAAAALTGGGGLARLPGGTGGSGLLGTLVAVVGFVEVGLVSPGVVLHPLRVDELVVIAPAGHPFAGLREVPLEELARAPFVLREEGSGTRQVAETHLRAAGFDPAGLRVVAELSSIDAIKACVAAGLGVSIVSRSVLPAGGDADGLVARRIEGLKLTRRLAAATLRSAPPLPAVRRLLDLLGAELAA
jgi:DNA-binding transcriptional LysR family regulator